jgi:heme-degrading monooxygenase HmoA
MFMRLVQLRVKPETSSELPRLYNERIIPALQQTTGCLYASLIQSVDRPDESISLTLWNSPEHAEAYEQGGIFQKLMLETAPYLSDSSEWKIQLSKDLTLEYVPVREEPIVKSYKITATAGNRTLADEHSNRLHVRIVSARIQPDRFKEFARLYAGDILPLLRTVPGCRYAFLTEGMENEVMSISIWNTKQDADAYEASGLFDRLTKKVQHTFTDVYQWKMAVEKHSSSQVSTSDDLIVQGYNVVTGKSFR